MSVRSPIARRYKTDRKFRAQRVGDIDEVPCLIDRRCSNLQRSLPRFRKKKFGFAVSHPGCLTVSSTSGSAADTRILATGRNRAATPSACEHRSESNRDTASKFVGRRDFVSRLQREGKS